MSNNLTLSGKYETKRFRLQMAAKSLLQIALTCSVHLKLLVIISPWVTLHDIQVLVCSIVFLNGCILILVQKQNYGMQYYVGIPRYH